MIFLLKIEVWQTALIIVKEVYKLVKIFPKEAYVLKDQITRAAISISLNIAEGSGGRSKIDLRRFIYNAIGSSPEVMASARVAIKLGYVKEIETNKLGELTKKEYFQLIGLKNICPNPTTLTNNIIQQF